MKQVHTPFITKLKNVSKLFCQTQFKIFFRIGAVQTNICGLQIERYEKFTISVLYF